MSLGSVLFSCLQASTEYGVVVSVLGLAMASGLDAGLVVALWSTASGACLTLVPFYAAFSLVGSGLLWLAFLSLLFVCALVVFAGVFGSRALQTSDTCSLYVSAFLAF